jgi:hypothetical protein
MASELYCADISLELVHFPTCPDVRDGKIFVAIRSMETLERFKELGYKDHICMMGMDIHLPMIEEYSQID